MKSIIANKSDVNIDTQDHHVQYSSTTDSRSAV